MSKKKIARRIFWISVPLLLMAHSCKESPILEYSLEQDGIYFIPENASGSQEKAFNFAYIDHPKANLGDSLLTDTLSFYLRVLGRPAQHDRKVYFKVEGTENKDWDSNGLHYVTYPEPFLFRANLLVDTVKVVVHRPEKRQTAYGIGLVIDYLHPGSDFAEGAAENMTKTVVLEDRYELPPYTWWPDAWFGEYSVEKHAFCVTVLQNAYFFYMYPLGAVNIQLREALAAYNAAHPNQPKDFTFPINTNDW